jgi:ClpP class serine protease
VHARLDDARRLPFDAGARASWSVTCEAAEAAARDGLPRNLTLAGSTAEILVEGVLTKRPDFWAWLMGAGNTTYASIRQALAVAEQDPNVKSIVLAIDSPGGSVNGLFETLDQIATMRANSSKTLRVRAESAESAAYAIAAAAGDIEASSRASAFGSIGTAASFRVDPGVVTLTNTDSPDKRPDVTTASGKAVVVQYLDQVNDEFVRAIARGRGVTASAVAKGFGRGSSFTAKGALERGMIDKISTPPRAVKTTKGNAMARNDDDESNDNRATAAATDAAVQRGVTQERERVLYHLQMGEAAGDMSIAVEAIRSGAGNSLALLGRYESARMNRSDRSQRQTETDAAARAVAGHAPAPAANDLGDDVVAQLKASSGSFVRE